MSADRQLIHATCVSQDGRGILLLGNPGSGKSDLALRMVDRGAMLVSDDQVEITARRNQLLASSPSTIAGLFEMRGVGIFQMDNAADVPLVLAVSLVSRGQVERMPSSEVWSCLGISLPLLSLHAFDASTDAKIRMFLRTL